MTSAPVTSAMIGIGNFFFRYRNQAFPLIILGLVLLAPPATTLPGSAGAGHVLQLAAIAMVPTGLFLRATVIGYAYIRRGGLNKRVYAKDLVTEGMFGVCRNPLYVGNMLIYSGVFLFHGNPFVAMTGVLLFAFIYQCIVLAEEEFLLGKFGDAYRSYCRDVPRWALKLSRMGISTEGMAFNLRRVIAKDYSTIAAALVALLAIEFYRSVRTTDMSASLPYLSALATLLLLVGLSTAMVSLLKKRGVFDEKDPLRYNQPFDQA